MLKLLRNRPVENGLRNLCILHVQETWYLLHRHSISARTALNCTPLFVVRQGPGPELYPSVRKVHRQGPGPVLYPSVRKVHRQGPGPEMYSSVRKVHRQGPGPELYPSVRKVHR
jgi:hypothetical protein